ncbi:MAG: S41 family peptidase, partial [bacterium]|nr:S41 family peptidase [bacterium]
VYGISHVRKAQISEELKAILEKVFLPVAPTLRLSTKPFPTQSPTQNGPYIVWQHKGNGIDGDKPPYKSTRVTFQNEQPVFSHSLFDAHPQLGDTIQKLLVEGLYCQLPIALPCDPEKNTTLAKSKPFEDLQTKLSQLNLQTASADHEVVRLADIVIAWNVFQHFYPYFDVINTDWDAQLTQSFKAALKNRSEGDFYNTLCRMVASLQDGHGNVGYTQLNDMAFPPIQVDQIENQIVVVAAQDSIPVQPGDIVLTLNGIEASEALGYEMQYVSGSPQWKTYRALWRFGFGRRGSTSTLRLARGHDTLTVTVPRILKRPFRGDKRPDFKILEDRIYYINMDQISMKTFTGHLDELKQAKGIVFDLRGYANGNHGILSHLTDRPIGSARWQVPQIIYPDRLKSAGYDTAGRWNMAPARPRLRGKIVFLTDASAISYAESVMGMVEHYQLGDIVGRPTAGTNGDINQFSLPGGFRIIWTGMRVVKHDHTQHHLIGILPTHPVQKTIRAIVEGRDEDLEKALEIIRHAQTSPDHR